MRRYLWSALLLSSTAFADFIYMKEDALGKSVELFSQGTTSTLSTLGRGAWAIYPDISADGEEFVYAEGRGEHELHLTYFHKTKKLVQKFYPKQKGTVLHPKFSKNSRWIFYSAPGPQGKITVQYFDRAAEVARQGTTLAHYSLEHARFIDSEEESYFPRPSSDGNFVIYQRNHQGKREIVLFDRLENKKTVLAEGMSPALSFDETKIAFTAKTNGSWNIFVMDRITRKTEQLTFDTKDEMAPTFRPDNSLVFAANKSGNFALYHLKEGKWFPLIQTPDVDYYSAQFSGETEYRQSERAPFLGNPRSSFGTISHQGKLYMAGGHQGAEHTYPPESFTDYFMAYDIEANTWTQLAPRPALAHGYQLAAFGSYIYAFGGFAYSEIHTPKWKSLSQIDRYDISKNKWETIGYLKEPRSSNVAVTIDDKVYLAGGWNATPKFENDLDGKFHDTVEIFDLKTEKFELAPYKLPAPKRRALTGINLKGEILLIGGLGEGASHFELLKKVTAINPNTGASRELTPLPFPTFAPAAEVLKNELFVFGGMFKTGPMNYEYVSHIYGMDLDKNFWRHTGRSLKETKGFSQVFQVSENQLGILGGHQYTEGMDTPVKTFETFSN
jgi:hypothetical protein